MVGGTKGGGGKTTLTVNLTILRASEGYDVLLVDADDQGSASTFTSFRSVEMGGTCSDIGYTSVRLLGDELVHSYESLQSKYDDIIIDAGGRDTDSHRAALGIANVALIPFEPSALDVWELGKTSKAVKQARRVNPALQAFTLINCADPRGGDSEAAAEYASEIDGLKFIPHAIGRRLAFSRAAGKGQGITEFRPQNEKAIEEIRAVYDFAFNVAGSAFRKAANE